MRAQILSFATLLVCGCDNIPEAHSRAEIVEISRSEAEFVAGRYNAETVSRIESLESQMEAMEKLADAQKSYSDAISKDLDAVQDQVVNNAKVANDNVLNDATARGDCGRNLIGGRWTNTECTRDNYFKR